MIRRRCLADNGFANGREVAALESAAVRGRRMEVWVAVGTEDRRRRYGFRPPSAPKAQAQTVQPGIEAMRAKRDGDAGRARYRLRKQTVEPVFGIIKNVLSFRQFTLRGHAKVEGEWQSVNPAYNCKRLHRLAMAAAG